ncbi:MAG: preprotein translocase subunit SecY [Anaerolineae bacterium]|nr:Protein translocase subunit SecY [Anaerolineales bacterium]RIK29494.1 MAG: preprotein translocase subunit SecY [Anaerolineae bacterium]WKZ43095.1 MAG: preprotein translocase subunit SecY [Anaerolineales bacterium]WKZ49422.1 MAG: preprotein translocase subunit SecY [Anaerolineales bacterium]
MADKKPSAWRYLWKSEDIRRKLLITLGILLIFRIAANVPAPGVNREALQAFFQSQSAQGGFIGFLNLLSGGTISNFSLLSMGVYPYITAQIILQLLIPIIPSLQKRMEENPREGRQWMEKWTYYLAVPMAMLSAIGQINIFNSLASQPILPFGFTADLWLPSVTTLLVMTAGTMFAIWLGELISEYGIRGQGLSLVIFAGIVSQIPQNIQALLLDEQNRWVLLTAMLVIILLTVVAIVYVQQGRRNVPIMFAQKSQVFYAIQRGRSVRTPQPFLPLMVNLAGMIPLIFASAILQFPAIVASYFLTSETKWISDFATSVTTFFNQTGSGSWGYWTLYFLMVVTFTYFYTTVLFDQQNYGDNLKRQRAQIPGVPEGAATQRYLSRIQSRITLPGALLLGVVAIMPFLLQLIIPAAANNAGLFLVSSSGLLIVVGVVRDTFMNIEAELKLHGYQEKLLIS